MDSVVLETFNYIQVDKIFMSGMCFIIDLLGQGGHENNQQQSFYEIPKQFTLKIHRHNRWSQYGDVSELYVADQKTQHMQLEAYFGIQ